MEVHILGVLEVVEGDRRVPVRGPKQRALLAMLVLAPERVVPADVLVDQLWGGSPPAGALNTLQSHVAHLRSVLEPDRPAGTPPQVLVTAPPGYLLAVDDDAVDARLFERLVGSARDAIAAGHARSAVERLDRALALWRGPALAELASEPFAITDARRLEELRLGAVEDRFEALLALGQHTALVPELEAAANEHPLRERRWEQLMLALYRSGRQADALRAYRCVRDVLGEELGIEPGAALQRLEEAIVLQKAELDWVPEPSDRHRAALPSIVTARTSTPLFGRDAELERIGRAVDLARGGDRRLVLISGEPGIGKSRLAAEVAQHAHDRGVTVLWGRCLDDSLVEYQPFVEAIRPAVTALPDDALRTFGRASAELSRLLPELAVRLPELVPPLRSDPDIQRYLLFEAVATVLAACSQTRPILLVLDDVHAADVSTLLLMRHLVRHPVGAMVVVATYRDTEVDGSHPLVGLADALGDEGLCERHALQGLPPDEIGNLIEDVAGRRAPPSFTQAIGDQTDGNPFFVVEMVRHLAESDRLVDEHGEWLATAPIGERGLPRSVTEVITRRFGRLDAPTVRVLDAAAVVGRDFDAALAGVVSGVESDALADALDQAHRAGLVVESAGITARYAFAHTLIRDALYSAMGALRRAHLHGQVAAALERSPRAETNLAELAHHYSRAGDEGVERAITYARQAGDHALRLLAYEEAADHYEHALELLSRAPATDVDRCEVLVALGDAAVRAGAFGRAETSLAEAAEIARRRGEPNLLARVALACSGTDRQGLWVDYGLVAEDAVALLEEAFAAVDPADDGLRARLLAHLGLELYFSGDDERREETAVAAVDLARRSGDPATLGRTLATGMRAVWGPDNMEQRLAWAQELSAIADATGEAELRLAAGWQIPTLLELGRVPEADVAIDAYRELADSLRHPLQRVWSRGLQGGRAMRRGEFAETERLMTDGMQLAPELFDTMQAFAGQMCTLRWEQGRCEEVVEVAEAFVGQYGHVPAWRAGLAVLYAGSGRHDAAVREIEALETGGLDRVRRDQNWFFCMGALAEAVAMLDDARLAAPVYDVLEPYANCCIVLGDGFALLCSVEKSLGILARAMGEDERAAIHLRRALATHAEFGAPPLVARTKYEYGRVLLRLPPDESADPCQLLAEAGVAATALGMEGLRRAVESLA